MHPELSDHKWTTVGSHRRHLEIWSHICRWSGPHVTTLFSSVNRMHPGPHLGAACITDVFCVGGRTCLNVQQLCHIKVWNNKQEPWQLTTTHNRSLMDSSVLFWFPNHCSHFSFSLSDAFCYLPCFYHCLMCMVLYKAGKINTMQEGHCSCPFSRATRCDLVHNCLLQVKKDPFGLCR